MKKITLVSLLFLIVSVPLFCQSPPTIQACGPDQQFCLTNITFDLCVKITVTSGLPSPIDHFEIDWGDGSPIQTVAGSNTPPNQNHIFNFNNFFGTCTYDKDHFIVLETFLDNGTVLNNSFRATFINPPQANFEVKPSIICEGDEICFDENACPTEQLEIVSWDYGDGSPRGTDNCHTYNTAGTYTVRLEVKNPCGTDFKTMSLEVIKPPIADGIPEADGVVDNTVEPYIVCLGGGGKVTLNGDSLSLNEDSYEWSVIGRRNDYIWNFEPMINRPIVPDQMITFRDTGIFNIILTVNNSCNKEDKDTLTFRVLDADALTLNPQPDGCITLDYTPSPLVTGATYTLNGNPVSSFPVSLGVGNYTVVSNLTNECGAQSVSQNFSVTNQESVSILFPSKDTTVCVGSDLVLLRSDNNSSGNWSGSNLVTQGDSTLFNPRIAGDFTLMYSRGAGACEDTEEITISVTGVSPNASDYQICTWSDDFPLTATPVGGNWSSIDCPNCIQNDSFIVSEMLTVGLSAVALKYELISTVGCSGSISIDVEIDDPIADFSIVDTLCTGSRPSVTNNSSFENLLWRLNGTDSGSNLPTITTPGSYTIELIAITGSCRDSTTDTFIAIESPDLTSIGFVANYPNDGCAPLPISIDNLTTNQDLDFSWSLDGVQFSTEFEPSAFQLQQGLRDTTIRLQMDVGNICGQQSLFEDITIRPGPIPRFGFLQNTECSGDTVGISNVSFGGIQSWVWDYGNGVTSTDSTPLSPRYFANSIQTIYTLSLIGTNDCGTDTFSLDLTVNPTDVKAFFNTDPVDGCEGQPIQLINLSTLGASVLVDFGDGNTTLNPDTITHIYNAPGIYDITWKAFGCGFDSIVRSVEIFEAPELIVDVNEIVCQSDSLFFENQSVGANRFEWQFGDGDSSSLNNPIHQYDSSGVFTSSLVGISDKGCIASWSADIEVLDQPEAIIMVTDSVCVGEEIQFFNGSANSNTCIWDFGDGTRENTCNPTHSYSSEGSYVVKLQISDNNGCENSTQRLVFVYPNPKPEFEFLQPESCSPSIVQFQNLSTVSDSYFWEFSTGDTSRQSLPEYIFQNGGIHIVSLTAYKGVCSETITKPVTVNQTPMLDISVPTERGCAPFQINFTNNTLGQDLRFEWDFADGTTSFDRSPDKSFSSPDSLLVQVIAKSDFCMDTTYIPIAIFEPVLADVSQTNILCFGNVDGTIDVNVTGGTAPFQYQWSSGEVSEDLLQIGAGVYNLEITDLNECNYLDTIEILQPEEPLTIQILQTDTVSCYGGSNGNISIEASGGTSDYKYRWASGSSDPNLRSVRSGDYAITVTDNNNCLLETIVFVPQNDSIAFDEILQDISCFGANDGRIAITNLSGGVAPYSIIVPELDSMIGSQFNRLMEGDYTIIVTDDLGCQKQIFATISEPDRIWVEIIEPFDSLSIMLGESVDLSTNFNVSNPVFEWLPSSWLSCVDCEDPIAIPFDSVQYQVIMTDEKGCIATDSIYMAVTKERKVAIPDGFSPNFDDNNDKFVIRGKNPAVEQVRFFRVFDRWGGLLFERKEFDLNDPDFGWDGTAGNQNVETGHYIYHAQIEYIDGLVQEFKGNVLLIR